MPVEGIGENFSYATSILVNGVEQQSFVQESDSTYDVLMEPSERNINFRFTQEIALPGPQSSTDLRRTYNLMESFSAPGEDVRIHVTLNTIARSDGGTIDSGDRHVQFSWPNGSQEILVGDSFSTNWFSMSDTDVATIAVTQGNVPDYGIYETTVVIESRDTVSDSVDVTGVTKK